MKKRITAFLMALALCLSLLPTTVRAEIDPPSFPVTVAEVETSTESEASTVTLKGTISDGNGDAKNVVLEFELNVAYVSGMTYFTGPSGNITSAGATIDGVDSDEVSTASITITNDESGNAVKIDATVNMVGEENYTLTAHWGNCREHDAIAFKPWTDEDSLPDTAGNYYLTEDVTLYNAWSVPAGSNNEGVKITNLCLNGHVIKANTSDSETFSVINVPANATLNLYDCGTNEHYFNYVENAAWTYISAPTDEQKAAAVPVENITDGTTVVKLTGGVITGGYASEGGVKAGSNNPTGSTPGTLNMYGGNIVGNKATSSGGGVKVSYGAFNMYGGRIVGNWGKSSGGVNVAANRSFTMAGGSIDHNTSDSYSGGVCSAGTFTMRDGSITNNTSTFNTYGGSGVSVMSGIFTMSGGTISKNKETTANGGGVYVYSGTVTLGGTAQITGNEKENGTTSNLYLPSGKTVALGAGEKAPKTGMSVGVTTGSSVPVAFTTNGAAGDVKYFFSDSSANHVEYDGTPDECLKLVSGTKWNALKTALGGTLEEESNNGLFEVNNGTITLLTDFKAASGDTTLTVPAGKTVTLDLNGKVLSGNGDGSVITVESTGNLTLIDSDPSVAHKFAVSSTFGKVGCWEPNEATGDKTVLGGCITGGVNSTADGGGVAVSGSFTMSGGNIVGNSGYMTGCGGVGLTTSDSSFTMTGGKIIGNQGVYGGVSVGNGTITLGGTAQITDNIYDGDARNLRLSDGKIVTISGTTAPTTMSVGVTLASDTGVFTDENSANYSALFTPDAGTQNYKVISRANDKALKLVKKYNVTVNSSITNGTVATNATSDEAFEDDTVTLTVTPDSGYQLKADSLKVTKTGSADVVDLTDKKFTMPAYAVTVTAEFEAIPAPPSGGGGTPTVTVPVTGDKDSVKISATVSGSNATVKNVTSEQLDKVGTGENVTVDLSGLNKSVSGVTIPKTTLENVAASEASGLEIKLPNGTAAVFDSATVAAVAEQATGSNIQLVVDKESKAEQALTAAQKETVEALNDTLVLEAYFVSNGKRISDFKGGSAELTVSYPTTKPVRVWYVAEDGSKTLVPSTFDGKAATFVVTHFSHYAIEILDGSSYASCPQDATCLMSAFSDLNASAWYHDGVHFCLDNGLMNGVSDTQFAPNGTLTRGMVVTVLARLEGVTITSAGSEWYADGQAWAVANGISDGTNMTSAVTREQLATMLYRYAQFKGEGFTGSWMFLLDFVDRASISSWADEAVHWCSMKGVITGKDGKVFDPQGKATRAEAAAMFQRFCENVTK